jgi:hypothetical protein
MGNLKRKKNHMRWMKKKHISIKYRMTNHQEKNPNAAVPDCHSRQFLNGRLLFT